MKSRYIDVEIVRRIGGKTIAEKLQSRVIGLDDYIITATHLIDGKKCIYAYPRDSYDIYTKKPYLD